MPVAEACFKLAAYLTCVGIALEFAHRLYWQLNKRVYDLEISVVSRIILSSSVATIPLISAVIITTGFIRYVDKRSISTLGLAYTGDSLTSIAYGASIGLGCVSFAFLTGILMGYIEIRRSRLADDYVSHLPLFIGGIIDFFAGSVFEEVIFRGYVFFLLYEAGGAHLAIVGSSVVFALAHVLKHPSTPLMYALNAFIFGIIAATARHFTGALWLPVGLHFGWNVVSGPIFGLPMCGKSYERGMVVSEVSGPEWLTGGNHSLDAGFLGTVALTLATVGLIAIVPLK
ncbi:MAG: CPBP family intramembrane metalloprotease [Armatimonadota bacterium]|nr:CPBP family intramembrane metalloprotease [Armatimonadota bacterium]